jgi:hypothetical protein
MYRYIALLRGRRTGGGDGNDIDEALRHIGLQPRMTLGCVELYASDDTPVVSLSAAATSDASCVSCSAMSLPQKIWLMWFRASPAQRFRAIWTRRSRARGSIMSGINFKSCDT